MAKAVEFDPESAHLGRAAVGMTHARNVNDALRTRLVSKNARRRLGSRPKKENATQRLRASGATEVAVSLAEAVSARQNDSSDRGENDGRSHSKQ